MVPGVAVSVGVEVALQVVDAAGDDEITKPGGVSFFRSSINPIPVSGMVPVFLMVMVRVDELPAGIELGVKNLLRLAPGKFVKVAEAACVLLAPLVVVTAPAPMVLVRFPLTLMVVLRVSVQFEFAANVPPLNV